MNGGPRQNWFLISAICAIAFFILRIGFEIPLIVSAITVFFLSIVGTLLLGTGSPAGSSGNTRQQSSGAPVPRQAGPIKEPFILNETELAEGKGVSGFMVTPGQSIGGARFPKVDLLPDERVVLAVSGGRAGNFARASLGYITLTDQRLVFTGEKPLFDPLGMIFRSNLRQLSLPYSNMQDLRLQRRTNLAMMLASTRPALVIRTRDGSEYAFWPNVYDLNALVRRIEQLRAEAV